MSHGMPSGNTLWICCLLLLASQSLLAQQPTVLSGGAARPALSPTEGGLRQSEPAWHRTAAADRSARDTSKPFPPSLPADSPVVPSNYEQTLTPIAPESNATQPAGHAAPNALAATDTHTAAKTDVDSAGEPAQYQPSHKSTPLAPPTSELDGSEPSSSGTLQSLLSVSTSLLIVLGLFFGTIWFYRRAGLQASSGNLPGQVVQILGRTAMGPRQQLMLVQFGSKLVLVSHVQGEIKPLSEITDPAEVKQLAALCTHSKSSGPASLFGFSRQEVSS